MLPLRASASSRTERTADTTSPTRVAPSPALARAFSALVAVWEAFLATSRMVAFISSTAAAVSWMRWSWVAAP